MSSTRYSQQQQPLQIYQDPVTTFERVQMPSAQNPNTKKPSPLRPIKNAASRRNIVFNPPRTGVSKQSPLKSANQNSSSPLRASMGSSNKLQMVSMPPPGGPKFNTDSMEKKQPVMTSFKPQKALFTTFNAGAPADKENYPQQYYQTPTNPYSEGLNRANFSLDGLYAQKPAQKRTLLEAAPIHESRPLKKAKAEEPQEKDEPQDLKELPAPDSFAPLHDDGTKPTHSYAQLIGMSILRATNRRLTLAQIYKWISDTYSFYSATDAGWQNSIRHNLSLNKAFIKQERPKDDPGKGNYWAIQPGMEHQFIKEKPQLRKPTGNNQSSSLAPANLPAISQPEVVQFKAPVLPPAPELPSSQPPQRPHSSMPESGHLPAIQELSSDATIPASDALLTDEVEEELHQIPSSPLVQSSPPTAMMNSSPPPPVSRPGPKRNDTPPPVPRFPSSSRSRSHKRKYASMDDSGYFSSLDSSAMRPHRLLSDADRPRIKRGRAEEEIARLRGSSYDSPTKSRASFIPASSSPLRVGRNIKTEPAQMLPPLTPAVKLRAPMRPPPSVSPNTNLRMHRDKVREMVGSPLRGMTVLEDNQPWSPAFHLDDVSTGCMFGDFAPDFDIFADPGSFLSIPGNGSPEKRSAKRPRLDRSKSANILADISSSNLNKALASTPILKLTPSVSHSPFSPLKGLMESPSKLLAIDSPSKMPSPSFSLSAFDLPQEDFYGSEFLSEDINEGWDIMQGFQKIGSGTGAQSNKGTPKQGGRSSLGRSFTSRF
jgi:forkhead transcription factor HCM1